MHSMTPKSARFVVSVIAAAAGLVAITGLAAGCNKKADNTLNFTNAINMYYNAHPACLWKTPTQFPTQVDTSDTSKTAPYDALVDQGLLARSTAEKKVMIIASKQVTNYDLSEKGRTAWVADVDQPGFGNFCYGHRKVSSIDNYTPTSDQPGATTQVNYHYTLADVPAWANMPETQNAFPDLRTNLSSAHTGQATLVVTNDGWKVGSPSVAP
jgi:hypothetical protein